MVISKKSLPGSDITGGDHSGARAAGGAGQVVLHVEVRLDVADELYDHNVGHCVTKLWQTDNQVRMWDFQFNFVSKRNVPSVPTRSVPQSG